MRVKLVYKRSLRKRVFISTISILSILLIAAVFSFRRQLINVDNTLALLLDQVFSTINENNISEDELISSLEDDYIIRANTVDYMVSSNNQIAEKDLIKLSKIMKLLEVDEINFFDENGVIIGGSTPEYYGMSMNDGEQIGYFLPMLSDTSLTMVQPITPNTALGKEIMYAMVWRSDKSGLIQVGIEPKHLLERMENSSVTAIIRNMPMTDGAEVYLLSKSGTVLAASDESAVELNASEAGFDEISLYPGKCYFENLNGKIVRVLDREVSGYIVAISYDATYMLKDTSLTLVMILIFLLIVDVMITLIMGMNNRRVGESNQERDKQFEILESMSKIYNSMHLINLDDQSIIEYASNDSIRALADKYDTAAEQVRAAMSGLIVDEYREKALEFTNVYTVADRLKGKKMIYDEFLGINQGWIRSSFINLKEHEDGRPYLVTYTTLVIDSEKRKQLALVYKTKSDELTKLFNRRAYEQDILEYGINGIPDNLVHISMDVNGLKKVNDSLGHAAGDEMLLGACNCMQLSFGPYGKLYRVGGDEFVALINVSKEKLTELLEDFESSLAEWHGQTVESLAVSYGCCHAGDFSNLTLEDMEKIADKRMYDNKQAYYQKNGIDRRIQHDAFNILCNSYLKVLKANLSTDSYSVVSENLFDDDNDSRILSKWFDGIVNNKAVKIENKDEFREKTSLENISDYFKLTKESYCVTFARKIGSVYRDVLVEIIPANDYTDENQTVFVLAKDIK